MPINTLEKIHQIIEKITNNLTAELTSNTAACERVLSWLCDEESRKAYQRELLFIHLRLIISSNYTELNENTLAQEEWKKALELMHHLRSKNLLPTFSTALPKDHTEFLSALTLTFVLNQYSYKDLMNIHEGDIVFDCGGYFGETSTWALQKGAAKTYIFEPSPLSIPHIKANIEAFKEQERMILVPNALGAEQSFVPFTIYERAPGSSKVAQSPNNDTINVPQITLDDWCAENKVVPDFIKMDIEGAEVGAIKGAARTIAQHKPRVAISLYHRISDMWVIPNMLKELCPEYRFWCKKNAPDCEFVLYGSI